MILINPKSPHDAILRFVKNWMRLLAEDLTTTLSPLLMNRTESSGLQFGSGRLLTRRFLEMYGPIPFTPKDQSLAFEIDEHCQAEVIELEVEGDAHLTLP